MRVWLRKTIPTHTLLASPLTSTLTSTLTLSSPRRSPPRSPPHSHSPHLHAHLHTHTLLTSTLTLSSPPHSPPLLTTSRRGTRSRPGKLSTVSPPTAGTRVPSTASVPPSAPPRSLCRLLRSRRWRKLAAPSAKQGEHGELKTTSQNLHVDRSVYLTCFAAYDSKIDFRRLSLED